MNKQDISIVVLLVLVLGGWLFYQNGQVKKQRAALLERQRAAAIAAMTNETVAATSAISTEAQASAGISNAEVTVSNAVAEAAQQVVEAVEPDSGVEAQITTLSNDRLSLNLSSKGASVVSATLSDYRKTAEKDSEKLVLDSAGEPALAIEGIAGLGVKADYELVSSTGSNAVYRCKGANGLQILRTVSLLDDYKVEVKDIIENVSSAPVSIESHSVSIGEMVNSEKSKNGQLSVDALSAVTEGHGRLGKVDHWEKKGRVAAILSGRTSSGGCSRAPDAAMLPKTGSTTVSEPQMWVAVKSRFFTHVLTSSVPNAGYRISVTRSDAKGPLQLESVRGALLFPAVTFAPGEKFERSCMLYVGPKKYSVLRDFGPKAGDIMDFGFWKPISILVLWLLNTLYLICRNYGVAIILITILVRVVFWPLTHKSTESMKKMQEIQPILKDIQAKFKDDPTKLQQETMEVYRKYHVNPMSSCLPMLIQMPFFIAIFYVLRSAVELRFAPFLWIADLSEPENLFAGMIPVIHSLNILPLVMAATMYLQSKLSPSMGDPSQQRMMILVMPLMMLFMFYQMPSALVLYWSVSQLLAIIQLWRQKRMAAGGPASGATIDVEPENMTRQARRRAEREG